MVTRSRTTWLAGGGAILLVLSLSGIVAGATLVGDGGGSAVLPADPPSGATDTTQTFEDIDGNGVDDDCQDPAAVTDPVRAAAALAAADLDHDGTISVSEAAKSGWTGGKNCNHGGYVSGVAHGSGDECAAGGTTPTTTSDAANEDQGDTPDQPKSGDGESGDAGNASTGGTTDASENDGATCDPAEPAVPAETSTDSPPAVCPVAVTPPASGDQTATDTSPNAHGKAVSLVARSAAVGGKNCNHGGAVSAAAKKDHSGPHGKVATKTHGKGKGHNGN
jgi:hypothetical protein